MTTAQPATASPDLVDLLTERRKLRYAGDCKCGKCCLVPHEMLCSAIDEIKRLRRAAIPDDKAELVAVLREIEQHMHDGDDTGAFAMIRALIRKLMES